MRFHKKQRIPYIYICILKCIFKRYITKNDYSARMDENIQTMIHQSL